MASKIRHQNNVPKIFRCQAPPLATLVALLTVCVDCGIASCALFRERSYFGRRTKFFLIDSIKTI